MDGLVIDSMSWFMFTRWARVGSQIALRVKGVTAERLGRKPCFGGRLQEKTTPVQQTCADFSKRIPQQKGR
jgi:hypothetical protein